MRLAGKSISEVTYFVSSGMYNLNSVNQFFDSRWAMARFVSHCM